MMKKPQWYDVLEPRGAVIAGIVGLAIVYPIGRYAFAVGYVPHQYKDVGTAVDMLAFAAPYWAVKWFLKRRG